MATTAQRRGIPRPRPTPMPMVRCLSLPWSSSAGVDDAVGLEEVDAGVEVADSVDVVEAEKDVAEDVEEDVEWTAGFVAVTPRIVTVVGTSLTQPNVRIILKYGVCVSLTVKFEIISLVAAQHSVAQVRS